MATDKRISDLPVFTGSIVPDDIAAFVDVHGNITYQFSFAQLLTFISSNASLGANVSYGTTNPTTGGNNGDIFINTSSNQFLQKVSGTWTVFYTATPGVNGNAFTFGSADPSASGNTGDVYFSTGTSAFYKNTSSGGSGTTWTLQYTIASGPAGARGNSVLNNTRDPLSTDGVNGDFWLNTNTLTFFGPKVAGVWPSGVSIAPGVPNTLLSGNTDPGNTVGNNGDFYLNKSSYWIFGPKAGGVWPAGQSLIGPNSFYIMVAYGDPNITTNGSGQFTYTNPALVGRSNYLIWSKDLGAYLYTDSLSYNSTAGSFSVTAPGFSISAGSWIKIEINAVPSGSTVGLASVMPVSYGDSRLSISGGNVVFTDSKLIGLSGYPVFSTQLGNFFRDANLTYNSTAGSVTITL